MTVAVNDLTMIHGGRKMRTLVLLFISLAVFTPQQATARSLVKRIDQSQPQQNVELTTTILKAEYCSSSSHLILTLRLLFTNIGSTPILLQKKSSVISQFMVSRNAGKAAARDYVMEVFEMLNLKAAGFTMDEAPDLSLFTKLNPGESFSTERKLPVNIFETKDDLQPGKYVLQVVVPTWYYPPDWKEVTRERWREEGFLWTTTLRSKPMPFEVERGRPTGPCSPD